MRDRFDHFLAQQARQAGAEVHGAPGCGRALRPAGAAVLDGGTGTGEAVRLLLERANPARVVGVDVSKGMLRAAQKRIADRRVSWKRQDITKLPYADRSFDVALCTWTLETLADPQWAAHELLRVIKGVERLYGRLLEEWSAGTLRGRFLSASERPYHDCEHSRLMTMAGGLATVVVLRKCCLVNDPHAPCLPQVAGTGAGG